LKKQNELKYTGVGKGYLFIFKNGQKIITSIFLVFSHKHD